MKNSIKSEKGYSEVNGLDMYYEVHGEGRPLVLIHGGGSTIETTFANIIPRLAKKNRIIAMELQAHGRTADRNTPASFTQDANDVVILLKNLHIKKADFLGFSNGGHTLIEMALQHADMINKMILCGSLYKRTGAHLSFWEGLNHAKIEYMPPALKEGFFAVNNNEAAFIRMFNQDVQKMRSFAGWSDEQMKSIKVPTLIMSGDKDIATPEHAVEMHRAITHSQLVVLPGGHGKMLGTRESLEKGKWKFTWVADIIENFLSDNQINQKLK
ncbi:MAG TPA: alpha/beta hydrolase [Chitinophagaceae bacterium]|nr:alpha/beta hydrolase [Chitinophagaceae bacterium]